MKQLRVLFTILSALCVAALFPLGMIFSWEPAGYCLIGAFLFFGLMLLCKQSQEAKEEKAAKENPPAQVEEGQDSTDGN